MSCPQRAGKSQTANFVLIESDALATKSLPARTVWLYAGLFLVTLATLMLEVLDTRLLSVVTWYHLSFLAVSVAMLGMAGGAVLVFAGGELFAPERVARILPGACLALAIALPVSHLANLAIPMPGMRGFSASQVAALGIATRVLAVPFILSGVVVTLALTRTSAPVGLLYGADLIGAAAGCLVIVWLLERGDITSIALVTGACCALGSWCFARFASRRGRGAMALAALMAVGAFVNAGADHPLGVIYPKDQWLWLRDDVVEYSKWNAHSNVTVWKPMAKTVHYWGAGRDAPETPAMIAHASIDGQAGTAITQWDGDRDALEWVQYDVTAMPYHLRRGSAGIIGVGGGRDVLTAIWFGSPSITAIEINKAMLDAIAGPYRHFAQVVDHPSVRLIHDEARSYLTRTSDRFDVLQMSLIDTWAATGVGAFTLTENGLYTREGWQVFLRVLRPAGVFSVSRWFDPGNVSETIRLLSLGVAALLDFGVSPRGHLMLVTRDRIATLLVSPSPFSEADRLTARRLADRSGFDLPVTPWDEPDDARIGRIANASSQAELDAATDDPAFDFSAPTDRRPFFFNMLKPGALFWSGRDHFNNPGVMRGNLVATGTLVVLAGIAFALVAAVIVWPLVRLGRPALPSRVFGASLAYFALIGLGFMFVQIPFLQRFSVYLGHPTYAFSIVLFLMILSAGLGSLASHRIDLGRRRLVLMIPAGIAVVTLVEAAALQAVIERTVGWTLGGRTLVVAVFIVPLAFLMGTCFPMGARLLRRHSDRVTAWMWGVNGACGVMASILAVMTSMWIAIDAGLVIASALYLLLLVPMRRLGAAPESRNPRFPEPVS